jgi:hypothetical protein
MIKAPEPGTGDSNVALHCDKLYIDIQFAIDPGERCMARRVVYAALPGTACQLLACTRHF